jgi:predicted negative regulator of RcsB-dependent stress response
MTTSDKRTLTVVALIVLALAVAFGIKAWNNRIQTTKPETGAVGACLESVAAHHKTLFNARVATLLSNNKNELAALSKNGGSQPAYDAAKARDDFTEAQQEIKQNTEYCTEFAACYRDKPFKQVFDACYAALSEKEPEPADTSGDN